MADERDPTNYFTSAQAAIRTANEAIALAAAELHKAQLEVTDPVIVSQSGMDQLVKDLTEAQERIVDLERENKLLKRPTEDGYR